MKKVVLVVMQKCFGGDGETNERFFRVRIAECEFVLLTSTLTEEKKYSAPLC